MENEFSISIKRDMILIYVDNSTGFYRTYHLGLNKIICQKALPIKWPGKRTLYFLATVHTLLKMQELKLDGMIFTTYDVARTISEKENIHEPINSPILNLIVYASTRAKEFYNHDFYIWDNKNWGDVSYIPEGNNFEVKGNQLQKYFNYNDQFWELKKWKRKERERIRRNNKKHGENWTDFESFGW